MQVSDEQWRYGNMPKIRVKNTALIITDMQNDFVSSEGAMARLGFDMSSVSAILAPLSHLLAKARRCGVCTVHTRVLNDTKWNAPSWTAFWGEPVVSIPGSWGSEFVEPLKPRGNEIVITKYGYGAFFGTNLDNVLKAAEVDTVIVTGTGPNICSGETMHQAFALGYHVIAVEDCLGSFSRHGPQFNARLKEIALYIVRNHYGYVVRASDVIHAWEES